MKMFQFIVTVILFLPIFIECAGIWSYENTKIWSHDHHYCGGISQSPIDLQFNISYYDHLLRHLHFEKQYSHGSMKLINNGHTAQLNLDNHYMLKHVVPLSKDYIVEQIHFHWGRLNDTIYGSEHLLDGQSYPLEMHIVTYSGWFPNISEAATNTRALAVVGVFFELSNESNEFLQPIIKALASISHKGEQKIMTEDFDLKGLLGEKHLHRYYRYDGSLTTPPCYESVIWNVLQEPLKISSDQLRAFQSLYEEKHKLMKNTYRTIQPIGKRILFRSFNSENIHDDIYERIPTIRNHGEYLSVNMKILFVLISFLMMII